jgi:hypothetical protein
VVVAETVAHGCQGEALAVELDGLLDVVWSHGSVPQLDPVGAKQLQNGALGEVVLAGELGGRRAGAVVLKELLDSVGGEPTVDGMDARTGDRIRSSSGGMT